MKGKYLRINTAGGLRGTTRYRDTEEPNNVEAHVQTVPAMAAKGRAMVAKGQVLQCKTRRHFLRFLIIVLLLEDS